MSVHVLSVDVKAWTPNLRANESDIVSLYLMLETNTSNYGTTSKWKKKTVRGMAKNLLEKIAYFRIPCYSWNLGFKFSRGSNCQALSLNNLGKTSKKINGKENDIVQKGGGVRKISNYECIIKK